MGILLQPDELVTALSEQWPGREPQIRQLTALLSVSVIAIDRQSSPITSLYPRAFF
jgi:hypothetical protein